VIAVIGKPKTVVGTTPGIAAAKTCSPTLEARHAYYRRCQQFRRNGDQCKAPAVKGESICHKHAEQAATEERRARQRRELLATPGAGVGNFKAIQRTIRATAQALLDGRIDAKTAGRLIIELQTASKLLWQQHLLNHRGHRETRRKKEPGKEEKRLQVTKADARGCRDRRCSAVAGRMRRRAVTSLAQPRPAGAGSSKCKGQGAGAAPTRQVLLCRPGGVKTLFDNLNRSSSAVYRPAAGRLAGRSFS
jgi:hypothetical protein